MHRTQHRTVCMSHGVLSDDQLNNERREGAAWGVRVAGDGGRVSVTYREVSACRWVVSCSGGARRVSRASRGGPGRRLPASIDSPAMLRYVPFTHFIRSPSKLRWRDVCALRCHREFCDSIYTNERPTTLQYEDLNCI